MRSKRGIGILFPVLMASCLVLCSFTTFRNENGVGNANVVAVKTPIDTERGGTIWTRSFSDNQGKTTMNSDPILTEDGIYLVSKKTLYELDNQGEVNRQLELSTSMNSICHLLLEDDRLYIPLSGGVVECVDIKEWKSVWKSRAFGGQSLSTLFYHEGLLYGGTVNVITNIPPVTTGVFYCLDSESGQTVWTYQDEENPGGYYWSGGIVCGEAIFFTGENGILVSHSLTTEEVYARETLTTTAQIRSGLTYDEHNQVMDTVDTEGTIYQFRTDGAGSIEEIRKSKIISDATTIHCTCTPTICNNRIYIGCLADLYGRLCVLEADTLTPIYSVQGKKGAEIKSSPLVSTGYAGEENYHAVYVYVTYNVSPGGVYFMKDDTSMGESSEQTELAKLFEPVKAKQFCLASVTAGADGTLYYSNDSGTLFAVGDVDVSSDVLDLQRELQEQQEADSGTDPQSTPVQTENPVSSENTTGTSESVTAAQSNTVQSNAAQSSAAQSSAAQIKRTLKAPGQIKIKKTKKKIKIKWKKPNKKSQTIFYVKTGKKGKWKKKILSKNTSSYVLKKSKSTRKIRMRSRQKADGKWIYSKYTKTYTIKP